MLCREKIKYAFYLIFHPLDGFWDIKRERRGSMQVALLFVFLTIVTLAIEKVNTAFLFNQNQISEINVMVDIITVILVFTLWCVANWCTTSLMDGKGRMKDIVTAMGYALVPIILLRIPMVVLSHVITLDEGSFYYIIGFVSYAWTAVLVFFGTMMTHEYTLGKTIFTCLITIVGMAIILFIGLLFFNVISELIAFVSTIYKEIRFR